MDYYGDMFRYCEICNESVTLSGTFLAQEGILLHKLPRNIEDFGYVVELPDKLVCVFRGTICARQWLSNFEFLPLAEGKTIHEGFYDSWLKFKDDIQDIVSEYVDECKKADKKFDIWFVGHSRGSALACCGARDCSKNLGFPCHFLGYGCPNVGNSTFAAQFELLPVDAMKVRNGWDLVTEVPFTEMGFRAIGKETWIPQSFWHHLIWWKIGDHVRYKEDLARTKL